MTLARGCIAVLLADTFRVVDLVKVTSCTSFYALLEAWAFVKRSIFSVTVIPFGKGFASPRTAVDVSFSQGRSGMSSMDCLSCSGMPQLIVTSAEPCHWAELASMCPSLAGWILLIAFETSSSVQKATAIFANSLAHCQQIGLLSTGSWECKSCQPVSK